MERTRERHGDDYDQKLAATADDTQHREGRDAVHSSVHDLEHGNLVGGHGPIDLAPAADRIMRLIPLVEDDHLEDPTPCEGRSVRELLGHLTGLSLAFRAAADKDLGPLTDTSPDGNGWPQATGDWHEQLAERLPALVTAWYPQDAWSGDTRVGGVELPGEAAGVVALGELVLHGWDLARAMGQDYVCDEPSAEVLEIYVQGFDPAGTPGMFGPALQPGDDADVFDRVLARTGRDPRWTPPGPQAS
jgi:uncharacterized protein (TIGR03086 family)